MFTKRSRKIGKGVAGIASLVHGPNSVKVGFPKSEASASNIEKAIWNEFGTRGGASGGGWGGPIPERPFMRNAMRNNRASYDSAMVAAGKAIIRAALKGKASDAKLQALRKLGIKAQGDIQAEITSLTAPANSDVTIERKGSSKPLIDSGSMRGAVTWKVEN